MDKENLKVTDFPYIEITVRAYNTNATDETDGHGLVTFVAFCTDVGENGELGFVGGGVGSVVIHHSNGGPYLQIPHDQLWFAVEEALKKGEWKQNTNV